MSDVATDTVVDGRYKIVDRIGSGGMADVYRAEDTHLGREVALKILHRRFAQDAEFVERFRREARAAAGLQHPHVVGVYDRGEHEGTYYIAMELLEGRTLKDIVTAEAPLDQLRVIELGRQILQAAEFAHKRGVIHRDFKPHNVIVDADGPGQGHRLRHRPRGRVGDDRDRLDHGHRPVPVARAGAGPRRDRRVRRLLDRRDAVRDAHRQAAVRGRQRGVDRAQAPVGQPAADVRARRADRAQPRGRGHGRAGQGARVAVAERVGLRRRAGGVQALRRGAGATASGDNGTKDFAAVAAAPVPGERQRRRRGRRREEAALAAVADRRAGAGADRGHGLRLHAPGADVGAQGRGADADQGARPARARRVREGRRSSASAATPRWTPCCARTPTPARRPRRRTRSR